MSTGLLDGKVAIVTGAGSSRGMGRVMALAFVEAGARVAMLDVDAASLDRSVQEAREVGGADSAIGVVTDIASWEDAQRAAQDTIERLGGLHILINHAGVNPRLAGLPEGENPAFWELPVGVWSRMVDVNASGPFYMARAAVGHMVAQGWGRVIGVTTSLDTMIRSLPYGPTKAAHEALVACMASETAGTGVTVNALLPGGGTNTNFGGDGPPDPERLEPEIMGPPAVWLASDASGEVNGRRVIAMYWDPSRTPEENLASASAPAAWPQLGRQGVGR